MYYTLVGYIDYNTRQSVMFAIVPDRVCEALSHLGQTDRGVLMLFPYYPLVSMLTIWLLMSICPYVHMSVKQILRRFLNHDLLILIRALMYTRVFRIK